MAVITAQILHGMKAGLPPRIVGVKWETLTCGDTGSPFQVPDWMGFLSVQVFGTFNSETLTMQGSNDGTNWAALTDPQGNDIALTAAKIEIIEEMPRYVRPSFSGSSGGDLDVIMIGKK